jgi:xanthine dehydrogenase accessory factor
VNFLEQSIIKDLYQVLKDGRDIALITIVEAEGSSPRGIGTMMVVDSSGKLLSGTIGGGVVEEQAKKDAAECITRGISKTASYNLNYKKNEEDTSLSMLCGGKVKVFIKVFKKQDELIIVGAGHIAEKLSKIAKLLNYRVMILDDREDFITRERFPEADELLPGEIVEQLKAISINKNTNIVIVTHGHQYDQQAIEAVIDSPARYIGVIGSKNKVKTCFSILRQKGVPEEKIKRIYSPIGIDLGGETPEEISLSIMAEIQAVKYGKKVSSLFSHSRLS